MPKRHISQRSENVASDPLVNAANTLRDRQQDALRVYRPGSDAQERIHTSPATTMVISGANRCLHESTKIFDPERDDWPTISQMATRRNNHVLAYNFNSQDLRSVKVQRPFVKSREKMVRIWFSNDTELTCTPAHRLLTSTHDFVSVEDIVVGETPLMWLDIAREPSEVVVRKWEWIGESDVWDLHVPIYSNYWTGLVHHNSGKTVCGFAEAASRILGIPIFNRAGKKIPLRFPVPKKKENFEYWFIGHDLDHIGQTIYRILFMPGLFYVIWDPAQEQFVAWNENIKWHELNIEKRLPAGPLIPSDLIDENSWTWNPQGGGKGSNCFESVAMKNGAVIRAFPSSTPQAKQGDPVRGIVVDEDVKYGEHVPEYFARLADYGGWFMWPAWPHDENYMLSNLIDGCEKAEAEGDTRFEHIKLTLTENPFINNEKKRLQIARFSMLGDEEMVQSRIEGERHLESRRMYDFQPGLHGISSEFIVRAIPELDPQTPRGILQKIYRRDGQLPREWTRYAAIDPSTRRTAVLVGCVPPPVVEGVTMTPTVILEYEVVVKRFNPYQVAAAIQESADGRVFEAFIMDRHFGRQVHQSAGMATWDVFAKAFDDIKLYSRQTRNYFIPSCDIVADRCAWVRDCLRDVQNASSPQENLHPQLIVILDKTPETQKEFLRYYRKKEVITGIERITELPENPRKFDCMQGLEYLIAYLHPMLSSGVGYVEPETQAKSSSPVKDLAEKIMGRVSKYIHLGPGQAA